MRARIAGLAFLILAAFVHSAPALTSSVFLYSHDYGGTSFDYGRSVATDASGNTYVAGNFSGSIDFGGGPLFDAGNGGIFLVKFSAVGIHEWSRSFGSASVSKADAIAVDASGNVFMTGYLYGTLNLGGADLSSGGMGDVFLAKFNTNGVHQWSHNYGGIADDRGLAIAVDASGNSVITGYFSGQATFGGAGLYSPGIHGIFLARYNPSGVHQWSQGFGGNNYNTGNSVAVDASSRIALTGYFSGSASFGGDSFTAIDDDAFLAVYASDGSHQWSRQLLTNVSQGNDAVSFDTSGNILFAGEYQGAQQFAGVGNLPGYGNRDMAVARFSPGGVVQWSEGFGGESTDYPTGIATDRLGNVLITGTFAATASFGGDPLTSLGSYDGFIAKYTSAGSHLWSRAVGGSGQDYPRAIATDVADNALVTGEFESTASFGGDPLTSAGAFDVFLAKYGGQPEPHINSITDIRNDQGRKVRIAFGHSGYDNGGSPTPVVKYEAFRRKDAPAASASANGGPASAMIAGWEMVGEVSAHGEADYLEVAPTLVDSTIAYGQHYSAFFIRAATADPYTFWDSPADSGWSVDNLAPGVPGNFVYSAGLLLWTRSAAEDFNYFTVYGSAMDSFEQARVINYSVDPSLDVNRYPFAFYFVTATDFSGNEGKPAKASAISGLGDTPRSYVLSVSNYPNPFNPRTTVKYTVPSRGMVDIQIYDASGALVATLFHGERNAGAYSVDWDGCADNGDAVASGLYFARVGQNGLTRSHKAMLLK